MFSLYSWIPSLEGLIFKNVFGLKFKTFTKYRMFVTDGRLNNMITLTPKNIWQY